MQIWAGWKLLLCREFENILGGRVLTKNSRIVNPGLRSKTWDRCSQQPIVPRGTTLGEWEWGVQSLLEVVCAEGVRVAENYGCLCLYQRMGIGVFPGIVPRLRSDLILNLNRP